MEDTMMDDGMRTPTMRSINVAEAFDWQHRANFAEKELLIERSKLASEKRKNWKLRSQVSSSVDGWTTSNQHCQALVNSNYSASQEIRRLKCIIETLEDAIQKLFTASQVRDNNASMSPGYVTIEG